MCKQLIASVLWQVQIKKPKSDALILFIQAELQKRQCTVRIRIWNYSSQLAADYIRTQYFRKTTKLILMLFYVTVKFVILLPSPCPWVGSWAGFFISRTALKIGSAEPGLNHSGSAHWRCMHLTQPQCQSSKIKSPDDDLRDLWFSWWSPGLWARPWGDWGLGDQPGAHPQSQACLQ